MQPKNPVEKINGKRVEISRMKAWKESSGRTNQPRVGGCDTVVKWRKLNQWEFPVAAYGFAYARTFNLAHTRSNVPWLRVIVSKISKQLSSSLESQPYPSALSPAALRASKHTTIVFPPIHFSILFFSTPVSSLRRV